MVEVEEVAEGTCGETSLTKGGTLGAVAKKVAELHTADENLSFPTGPKVCFSLDFDRKVILEASSPL